MKVKGAYMRVTARIDVSPQILQIIRDTEAKYTGGFVDAVCVYGIGADNRFRNMHYGVKCVTGSIFYDMLIEGLLSKRIKFDKGKFLDVMVYRDAAPTVATVSFNIAIPCNQEMDIEVLW